MALVPMSPAETTAVIDDVKRNGFDPGVVHSCMPSSDLKRYGGVQGILGCNVWDRCPFDLTRNGGFKGRTWRPRDVIYYIEPNDGSTHAKEDVTVCRLYVQLLKNKEEDGRRDLDAGRNGEIVQIIGHEPCAAAAARAKDDYKPATYKEVCPDCGARHYYSENVMVKDPKSLNPLAPEWKNRQTTKLCPEYMHPSKTAGEAFERDIRADARERMNADAMARRGPAQLKDNPNADWEAETEREDVDLTLGGGAG